MNSKENSPILAIKDLVFNHQITYSDLTVNKGELVFVQGPSGSGKSSLLRLFNGTYSPSCGEVFYKGQAIRSMDTIELRRQVLLISQRVYLFQGSVRDNFHKYYDYRQLPHLGDDKIKEYLELAQFPVELSQSTDHMSGGEQQRVFIAIALSFQPEILLMDEPTSALDHRTAKQLFQGLIPKAQEKGITLIIVSHDAQLITDFPARRIKIGGEDHE